MNEDIRIITLLNGRVLVGEFDRNKDDYVVLKDPVELYAGENQEVGFNNILKAFGSKEYFVNKDSIAYFSNTSESLTAAYLQTQSEIIRPTPQETEEVVLSDLANIN